MTGTPEDIAGAMAYPASEDGGWITAQGLAADGGVITVGGSA